MERGFFMVSMSIIALFECKILKRRLYFPWILFRGTGEDEISFLDVEKNTHR